MIRDIPLEQLYKKYANESEPVAPFEILFRTGFSVIGALAVPDNYGGVTMAEGLVPLA